jgi:lysosomal acid lipase/cholesteryl ester hydrolase
MPVINAHSPAGASTMNMLHYAQIVRSGIFRQYDHGANNILVYGQLTPPTYNFNGHAAPVHFYHSTNDWMAAPGDVMTLYNRMGGASGVKLLYLVPQTAWNHMDFVWGINVRSLVYNRMVEEMQKYD